VGRPQFGPLYGCRSGSDHELMLLQAHRPRTSYGHAPSLDGAMVAFRAEYGEWKECPQALCSAADKDRNHMSLTAGREFYNKEFGT